MKTFYIKTKEQQRLENHGIEYVGWCHGSMDWFEGRSFHEGHPNFVHFEEYGGLTLKDHYGIHWWFASELYQVVDMPLSLTGDITMGLNTTQLNSESIATRTADIVIDRLRTDLFKEIEDKEIQELNLEDEWAKSERTHGLNLHNQTRDGVSYGCNVDVKYSPENPQFISIRDDSPISLQVKEKDAVTLKPLPSKRMDVPIVLKNIE